MKKSYPDNTEILKSIGAAKERLGRDLVVLAHYYQNDGIVRFADLKAFCGKNGGLVCTSANARKVMEHVFSCNGVPFFFPDENLGKNTAHMMGMSEREMFLWDPYETDDKMDETSMKNAKVFLWKGFCTVHATMLPSHVEEARKKYQGIKVIVHPECIPDTVNASDMVGSTSFIKNTVEKSAAGSKWAIGTEINFVNRIKKENPDKFIVPLLNSDCLEMSKITTKKLLNVLENLVEGKEGVGQVLVDNRYIENAKIALDRMLEIG